MTPNEEIHLPIPASALDSVLDANSKPKAVATTQSIDSPRPSAPLSLGKKQMVRPIQLGKIQSEHSREDPSHRPGAFHCC
jgi:hypothetical protein